MPKYRLKAFDGLWVEGESCHMKTEAVCSVALQEMFDEMDVLGIARVHTFFSPSHCTCQDFRLRLAVHAHQSSCNSWH